jgi:deoxyribose-phosphate aldolase
VIDFPNGDSTHEKRIKDVESAIAEGAQEIDIVFPYKEMKENGISLSFIMKTIVELNEVQTLCSLNKVVLKVIIESGELSKVELINIVGCCSNADVDYIKTSTGKVKIGARLEDIKLIKECINSS